MSLPTTYNLNLYKHKSFTKVFRLSAGNGEPIDLTGWTVEAVFFPLHGGAEDNIIDPTVEEVELLAGRVRLNLSLEDVATLPPRCKWRLQTLDAAGRPDVYIAGIVRRFD